MKIQHPISLLIILLIWGNLKSQHASKSFAEPFLQAKEIYLNQVLNDTLHPNYNNPKLDIPQIHEIKDQMNKFTEYFASNDSFSHLAQIKPTVLSRYPCIYFKYKKGSLDLSKNKKGRYTKIPKSLSEFMKKYKFHSLTEFEGYYKLETEFEYNFSVLARELGRHDNIEFADCDGGEIMGDGDRYKFDIQKTKTICTISIGWGDCPAGCIYRRYWEFIMENEIVRHARTYGSGTKSKELNKEDCFSYANIIHPFINNNRYKETRINDSLFFTTEIKPQSIYLLDDEMQVIKEFKLESKVEKVLFNSHSNSLIGVLNNKYVFIYNITSEKLNKSIYKLNSIPAYMAIDQDVLIMQYDNNQVQLLNIKSLEDKFYQGGKGIRVDTVNNFIQVISPIENICSFCLMKYKDIHIDTVNIIPYPKIGIIPDIINSTYLTDNTSIYKIHPDSIENMGKKINDLYDLGSESNRMKLIAKNVALIHSSNTSSIFNLENLKLIKSYEGEKNIRRTKNKNHFTVNAGPANSFTYDDQGNQVIKEKSIIQNTCNYTHSFKLTKNQNAIKLSLWEDEHFARIHNLDTSWLDSKPYFFTIKAKNIRPYSSYDWPEEYRDNFKAFCEFSSSLLFLESIKYPKSYLIVDKKNPKVRINIMQLPKGLLIYAEEYYTVIGERCTVTIPDHWIELNDILKEKYNLESIHSFN